MRIVITLFSLFFSVQDVLDIGVGDIRRINVYAACFRLELLSDFVKRAVRFVKSIPSGLPRLITFCWLILKNPDLQLE
jgi:hypothetical protein